MALRPETDKRSRCSKVKVHTKMQWRASVAEIREMPTKVNRTHVCSLIMLGIVIEPEDFLFILDRDDLCVNKMLSAISGLKFLGNWVVLIASTSTVHRASSSGRPKYRSIHER